MKLSPRTMHPLISVMALSLLAPPLLAGGAPARRAKAPAAAPKPVAADTTIIPLPLTPIVPAEKRVCTTRMPSGLGYTMLRPGSGAKPAGDATVLVNYIGYLTSTGVVFDQGMQTPMPVGQVIPGFSQGLQLMAKTGVMRICIPAAMGYGAQAAGPIPANSDLVFQVELLDFKTAAEMAEAEKQQAGQAAAEKGAPPKQ
jgi:FKBP-type peptidyl-prolyl cis-trans isomerase FkpA